MAARSAIIYSVLLSVTATALKPEFSHARNDYHFIPHAVELDTITFDKVLSQQNITAVMFMDFLSYGPKQTEFKFFAESTVTQPDVLAAIVSVHDADDMENYELATRFKLPMDQLPLVKLFVKDKEIATMDTSMLCDNIRTFITKHTGVWVGRTGTNEYLEKLASRFLKTDNEKERDEIVDLVKEYRGSARDDEQIKSSDYYLWVLEGYINKGPSFLGIEESRLRHEAARHRFHRSKTCSLKKEQNILQQSFLKDGVHLPHDDQ